MNKYDLTDIECIIEKLLNKYNEDAFDNRNLGANLYNYFEKEKITAVQEKNMIKLDEEKYDVKKFNILFKNINTKKTKDKKHFAKLVNSKKHNSLLTRQKSIISNKDKIPLKLLNYDGSNNNSRNNIINQRKKIFTPKNSKSKKMKFKLDKSFSSFGEDRKKGLSPRNKNVKNFLIKKNKYFYANNNNNLSKNFSSRFSQGKTMDSFMSDVSVNCNYSNFNNACISKLNYNIKKSNSVLDFETINNNNIIKSNFNKLINHKMNQIFGGNEKFQSIYNRCFSARYNNNSRINIFDSSQLSKEMYVDQRKEYILKNTRALFTRNKNFVQYKRRKKKLDKNI